MEFNLSEPVFVSFLWKNNEKILLNVCRRNDKLQIEKECYFLKANEKYSLLKSIVEKYHHINSIEDKNILYFSIIGIMNILLKDKFDYNSWSSEILTDEIKMNCQITQRDLKKIIKNC